MELRGEGVDERVSDQASAAVGATVGLYHIISDCMRRGGCGKRKRSGKNIEAWKACGRS
jgi:hypothetical protein